VKRLSKEQADDVLTQGAEENIGIQREKAGEWEN
jgi:hypothetical protein